MTWMTLESAIRAVDEAIAPRCTRGARHPYRGPVCQARPAGACTIPRISANPTRSAIGLLSTLERGVKLMTLAPEVTTPELLARLAAAGVILAAGHTDATYAQIEIARRHGLLASPIFSTRCRN